MNKGKGYPEHVKNTDKSFGDSFKENVQGKRSMAAALNKYDKSSYEFPNPMKKAKKGRS
jgi:hypothetical protein|tara:strand:+ start:617 stop:793 length:177 start_codon:yes stop_codon:yes gene_type:complete